MQTIDPEKLYKLSEVVQMHQILRSRGIRYMYYVRDNDPELFINTSLDGNAPRYFIKGSKLPGFLAMLDKKMS